MELHEAAARFKAMRDYLDSVNCYADEPFQVVCCTSSVEQWYFIQANAYISKAFSLDLDERKITKQRGGTRHFKTFEAAANALREIGQDRVQVYL